MEIRELCENALAAMKKSYSPYSKFKVGAALLTDTAEVYQGANIENAAYGPTNCAERTAFFTAICDGHRKFQAIAIAGGFEKSSLDYCYPCGVCRQVMREFCDPNSFRIYIVKAVDDYREYLLADLLPFGFGPENLA